MPLLPSVLMKRKLEKLHAKDRRPVVDESDDDDDDDQPVTKRAAILLANGEDSRSRTCPYLDTINRHLLDFDFEKLCSVSLSHLNVYACLVCGKYFQAVVLCSKKRFQFTEQGDAVEFMSWFLNALDMALKPKKRSQQGKEAKSGTITILSRSLRGCMRVYSRKILPVNLTAEEKIALADSAEYMLTTADIKFFYLTCDLPPPPLYLDEFKESIIPQVSLATLLAKFNGTTEKEYKTHRDSVMRRFELRRLPPYLILYMKRFVKNIFTLEKNPTIVNFPIKSIDFGDLLEPECRTQHKYTTYDLVANIVHDGPPTPGSGTHRIHLLHRGTGKWFEMQDLHVTEILPQMIPLSETLVQVWAVNKSILNPFYVRPVPKSELTKTGQTTDNLVNAAEVVRSGQIELSNVGIQQKDGNIAEESGVAESNP
ncbi:Ubiquitin specific protease 39 and snrnp assembly factor [Fasciola gigantica]|uniref:ubiquitinyl hydrolase 1 n=1 Tax=Fasciola gigantica TaxID=46835 RepID=A0A504YHZ3_FASGI|nr:Ubiquitin specific protease 39 and snrnp assembly factor [Fasciola gigantica]